MRISISKRLKLRLLSLTQNKKMMVIRMMIVMAALAVMDPQVLGQVKTSVTLISLETTLRTFYDLYKEISQTLETKMMLKKGNSR